jgi:hypothetical protein
MRCAMAATPCTSSTSLPRDKWGPTSFSFDMTGESRVIFNYMNLPSSYVVLTDKWEGKAKSKADVCQTCWQAEKQE